MKIMAIDYGDTRTGLAFSDLGGTLAGRSLTITEKNERRLIEQISAHFSQERPARVVLGLPKNMDGSEGPRAVKTRAFGDKLALALGLEIIYWDERGSSISANRILSDAGKKRQKQRAMVDAVAAAIILQNYLDYINRKS